VWWSDEAATNDTKALLTGKRPHAFPPLSSPITNAQLTSATWSAGVEVDVEVEGVSLTGPSSREGTGTGAGPAATAWGCNPSQNPGSL
jgi:hypothetical protein